MILATSNLLSVGQVSGIMYSSILCSILSVEYPQCRCCDVCVEYNNTS